MLTLKNIVKEYVVGDVKIPALKGVDLNFRSNEFVSILGPSGCGKTTLLNIIGGLDHYTSGDLVIKGRSTKKFNDRDWDSYRNHSIGFVFQNYNLIPHQTVLSNVELALTLSGVSKAERRERAKEALVKVGLGDQLTKKPSQMSGGQMQRVAIARALVNDPEILLADEPTGALDSETSVQIMELLKEIAMDRLVIMVTHNPDLADEYSTRIIRLLDGKVVDDTNPCEPQCEEIKDEVSASRKRKSEKKNKTERTSMSFLVALSLSFNNLMTKKTRTLLTSFAGSIGIIGIALILSLSTGINAFIGQVQEDTLSAYPLTIERYTQDMSALLSAMTSASDEKDYSDSNQIHVDDSLGTMMAAMSSTVENNLVKFKEYIEENYDDIEDYVSDVQYTYDYDLQIYTADGKVKVGMETMFSYMGEAFSGMSEMMELGGGVDIFSQMIDNQEILDQQYEVVAGDWPKTDAPDEVVLVVNSNNQISKMTLYILGILDPANIENEMKDLMAGNYKPADMEPYSYDYFLDLKFKLLTTSDFYNKSTATYPANGKTYPVWDDIRTEDPMYDQESFVTANGMDVKVVGIVRPREGTAATSISGAVGYTKALANYILDKNEKTDVINQQKETPDINVLTGLAFEKTKYTPETIKELVNKIDSATMDVFYSYMTEQILTNPEFSDRIQVKDTESFLGMYMLLPKENQTQMFSAVLNAALADPENKLAVDTLFGIVSQTTGGIDVNPNNAAKLLPILDVSSVMTAFVGVPDMNMSGLIQIAGDEAMSQIYSNLEAAIKNMTVNEEIFLALLATLKPEDPAFIQLEETLYSMAPQIDATYESVLLELDDAERASPDAINFFAKDFESKEKIEKFIEKYNDNAAEADKLEYTDLVGALMSSVTIIVNAISYVLIAFVAISLVVSSIMIGIITNISVLERTKEIGILRAIGASKKDISRVFNAETITVGFVAGALGILITLFFNLIINIILSALTGLPNLKAILPVDGAIILVVISMLLTFIAGLIPAGIAAKKDPVIALRSE